MGAAELAQTGWVLREHGSGTRSVFEAELERLGLPGTPGSPGALNVILELPSNESVRAAVEAGMGATALSATVAAPSLEAGLLERVHVALPERDFVVVRHRERHLSRAAEAFRTAILPVRRLLAADRPGR